MSDTEGATQRGNLSAVSSMVASPVEVRRTRRQERGMTTAEYAVGTVAAVTFVGVLIKVLSDPSIFRLVLDLITWVLRQFWGN